MQSGADAPEVEGLDAAGGRAGGSSIILLIRGLGGERQWLFDQGGSIQEVERILLIFPSPEEHCASSWKRPRVSVPAKGYGDVLQGLPSSRL